MWALFLCFSTEFHTLETQGQVVSTIMQPLSLSICISETLAPKADNNPRISYGNHLLIKTNSNTTKESAIAAIDQGYYEEARGLLQKSLAQHPNDPESVIYLSNVSDNLLSSVADPDLAPDPVGSVPFCRIRIRMFPNGSGSGSFPCYRI